MEELRITDSGVKIYQYKNESLHGFYISLFLRSGAMHEDERDSGITHFLEHVLIRNVNACLGGKLYQLLDSVGLEFNASSYSEMVQFYISGSACSFSCAVYVISKLFSEITLSKEELEAERRRIKAEIREGEDRSSLSSISQRAVFSGTSLERPITGTLGSVSNISKKKLEDFRRRVFTPENIFFYVTGSFSDADIDKLAITVDAAGLERGISCDNLAPVPQNFRARRENIIIKNSIDTSVRFNFDIDMTEVSFPALDLLYDILFSGYNSAFFIEMSERRGLFYDISAQSERYKNIGTMAFSFEVKGKDLYEALRLSAELLSDYRTRLVPEDGMMKAGYVKNSAMLYDDIRELNFTMAYDSHIMDLGYEDLDLRSLAYKNVTPEDVRHAADRIFRLENLTLVIKGDRRRISEETVRECLSKLQ